MHSVHNNILAGQGGVNATVEKSPGLSGGLGCGYQQKTTYGLAHTITIGSLAVYQNLNYYSAFLFQNGSRQTSLWIASLHYPG